ncbi:Plant calmodulin-binding domain [Musa troglodytarum]|uniref:Plant calmodulin-binding domain n=1 Tax=Musa troglodytarum TaxID=320322 RepID=A0A9E7GCR4_9LILI|nr:Plant calmodulin-binding domain [Musa troglodytarum]
MPDGEHNQSHFMTVDQRKQKSELKPRTTDTKDELTDKTILSEQMDLPPEKIIQTSSSLTNLAAGFVHESSSLKHISTVHDRENNASFELSAANQNEKSSEEFMDVASDEHESAKPSRRLFCESVITKLDTTTLQNGVAVEECIPITELEGSSEEPVSIKFMISSTIQENFASCEHKAENSTEGSSLEQISTEMRIASPIIDDIAFAEYQIANGVDESSNKSMNIGMKALPGSSEGPSSLKLLDHKSKASAKGRPAYRAEALSKEALSMKLKTPPSQKSSTSTMNTPIDQAGFAKKQIQVRSSRIGDKTKIELNMLKRNEETGSSNGHKVIKEEQCDISVGPKCVKKNFAARKTTKSIRLESEQEHPSFFKSNILSAAPRVVKKATLPPSKTVDRSFVGGTSLKLKVLVKSSPPSISSTGLFDPRYQEKMIKVGDKSNRGKEKAFESLSTLPSAKSQLSRVSSMKLRKYRKVIPSFTANYQAKAGNFDLRNKTIHAFEPKLEKIDLKALRQKLRKRRSHPERNEELKESGSQLSGSSETVLHREASQRTYRDVCESEIKSAPERNTDVDSEYKTGTPHKSNISRSKMVNLHPENNNNPPMRLRFRQVQTVGDNRKAKEIRTKSLRNRMESDGVGPSASPSDSINVVLRHQDVNDKKDTQGLFNNVIEETASKLVESRKSKVKALVGAFETIISLQESKVAPLVAVP